MSRWNTVAIFGVGLIGGSIGIALRERNLAEHVVGLGRSEAQLLKAREFGAITASTTNIADLKGSELVVVCTPVQRIAEHVAAVAAHVARGTLITDGGSTKASLIEKIETRFPEVNFVGSHPLAGSDRSGVEFATGDLFEDRKVVVTPTHQTDNASVEAITDFWRSLGATVVLMDPSAHDAALARTSHLPHVLASALSAMTREEELDLVAGGWRDTTRIAAADVELWQQILLENKENVACEIAKICGSLQAFQQAITENDSETLARLLAAGKQRRDAVGS